ncbi:MAG: hypothetical protein WD872_12570 [Pirellulaceae bacterium]
MRNYLARGLGGLLVIVALSGPALVAWSQTKAPKVVRRAQLPEFDKAEFDKAKFDKAKLDTFFADAFQEGLTGERPANLGQAAAAVAASPVPGTSSTGSGPTGVPGAGWSAIISATTIEDEVKALKLQVDKNVTTPSDFAGKGYKLARRDFTTLAVLFGIAGEYDGEVRWKKEAPAARDVFARTAANAKVGTNQVFQEAKLRKDELTDLLGGASPYAGKEVEIKASWKDVCDRAPLMQHLEAIWEPRLKPLLADKGQFDDSGDKIVRDAEMIAAIGILLAKEGMTDADADEYTALCAKLRDGARAIVDGVKQKNYDSAAQGSATITKACAECHENYRS